MNDTLIVVSDATPLNILVRIRCIDVLPELYGRVYIPPAVAEELSHSRTPAVVRAWLAAEPRWVEIRSPTTFLECDARDRGEREAIRLALELNAHYILLDEKHARKVARDLKLNVVGTVGILELAAERRLLDLATAFDRIRETDFYLDRGIIQAALDRNARRRPAGPAES